MSSALLPRLDEADVGVRRGGSVAPDALDTAREIEAALERGGERELRRIASELGDLAPGEPLLAARDELERARTELEPGARGRLERVAGRIRRFASAQRDCLRDLEVEVPGGRAGHRWLPIERAGCYAPGGRYPLPSSVLMTAIPARVAGVEEVWLASPRPGALTLAAAAVAGCDGVLRLGGAQAILALARGLGIGSPCDAVVGPGNRYVVAAKRLVAGRVRIDSLAGPSELVVVAGAGADPDLVAADLLAQAEHDPEAVPIVIALDAALAEPLDAALRSRLDDLPTADVARAALANGGLVVVPDEARAAMLADRLAPEHLEVRTGEPEAFLARVRHAGAAFLGAVTSTVLGDYGIGPNHTLPTGGAARAEGGLSVASFLRLTTWLRVDDPAAAREACEDAAWLAREEGLEGHARAVEARL